VSFTSCLRQVIKIQKPIFETNDIGNGIEKWGDFKMVRAEVKALSEKSVGEMFSSMQLMEASFYRFRIRYILGIKNNMRIIYNERNFLVKRVINQSELNVILIIIAQEYL
jgi:SPP1 family predicted phage head-tail adaptor